MKTLLAVTFVVSTLFAGTQAFAGNQELNKTKKVKVTKAGKASDAKGFETYHGKKFSLKNIRGRNESIVEVLRRHQIEMTSGEIVYPEEVEFVLVPNQAMNNPKARAPHGDEGSGPGMGKAPKGDD